MALLDENGHEILDDTPIAVPLQFRGANSLPIHTRIRNMILQTIQDVGSSDDHDSFEEADDFEIDDDPSSFDATTPFEEHFDHITGEAYFPAQRRAQEMIRRAEEYNAFVQAKLAEVQQAASTFPSAPPAGADDSQS